MQLKRLPDLAKRDGATLVVSLYPAGTTTFADADVRGGQRTYSLYDYISEINAVVLYVTEGTDVVVRAAAAYRRPPYRPAL